jgi:hypothetical protein
MEYTFAQTNEVGSTKQIEKSSIWMVIALQWAASGVVANSQVSIAYHLFIQRLHTRQISRITLDGSSEDKGDDLQGKGRKESAED